PRMYGSQGWYHYVPARYDYNAAELYYLSLRPDDRARLAPPTDTKRQPNNKRQADNKQPSGQQPDIDQHSPYRDATEHARAVAWFDYLAGKRPDFPAQELRADFERIRQRVAGVRADTTTPDTRLADDPLKLNPCSVGSMVNLMLG